MPYNPNMRLKSRTVDVSSNKWDGTKEVKLPSNFDSLNIKDKLDVLSGRKEEEDKKKRDLSNIVRGGGSSGGSSRNDSSNNSNIDYSNPNVFVSGGGASVPKESVPGGGVVNIGDNQTNSAFRTGQNNSNVVNIEDKIRGQGAGTVTREMAVQSLEEKLGRKLNLRELRDDVEIELLRLQSLSYTPSERERADTYGAIMTGVASTLAAPLVFGTGAAGTIVTGLSKTATLIPAASVAATDLYDTVLPSEVSADDRIGLEKRKVREVKQRIAEEGFSVPFVDKQTEKNLLGAVFQNPFDPNSSFGVGNFIYDLPGGIALDVQKSYDSYYNQLIEKGYSDDKARSNAKILAVRDLPKAYAEFFGLVVGGQGAGEISGSGTQYGLNVISGAGKKTLTVNQARVYSTLSGAAGGFVGGSVETALIYPYFKQSRREDYTAEEYFATIAAGGIFAAGAGAVVGGLVANKTSQKFVYNTLGVSELGQEFVGDASAKRFVGNALDSSLIIKGLGKNSTKQTTNTLNVLNIFNPNPNNAGSRSGGSAAQNINNPFDSKGNLKSNMFTPSESAAISKAENQMSSMINNNQVLIDTYNPPVNPVTNIISGTPTNTNVPNKTDTLIDNLIITNNETPVDDFTNEFTETNTKTQTNIPTNSLTYASTITAPFVGLPFTMDFSGSGSGKGKARSRKKYFNELASAKGLLTGFDTFTGYQAQNVFGKQKRVKPTPVPSNYIITGFEAFTGYDTKKIFANKVNPFIPKQNNTNYFEPQMFNKVKQQTGFNFNQLLRINKPRSPIRKHKQKKRRK